MLERTAPNVLVAALALLVAAHAIGFVFALGPWFPWKAVAVALAGAVPLLVFARPHRLGPRFGHANRVTLARAALVALLFALWGERSGVGVAWLAIGVAVLVLVLDGVDGWLARRGDEVSALGARFDMETDTLLILATAGLVWQLGKAGPWILLAGLLRYVFVAAGQIAPWLGQPLPYRRRRQTICILHEAALLVCLAPFLRAALAQWVALAALAGLCASFAIDIAWLARRRAVPSTRAAAR